MERTDGIAKGPHPRRMSQTGWLVGPVWKWLLLTFAILSDPATAQTTSNDALRRAPYRQLSLALLPLAHRQRSLASARSLPGLFRLHH